MAYKPAIASMSLGRAWVHQLPTKLTQASRQNFQGVEIFYEDLEYVAQSLPGGSSDANLVESGRQIRQMCAERGLAIIGLQPFLHYEGLTDAAEHARRIEKLRLWFRIVKALDTDIIQIPSNFLTAGVTGDVDRLVADLRELADLGRREQPVVRFAYENLCWGTFVDGWEAAWELVQKVDRDNLGMCLDTFNIAGREWADPSRADGKVENADELLKRSLERMVEKVDVRKVFYVQVVDAERMRNPLVEGHAFHIQGQPARMSWSRNARLFAFEKGGYLPVLQVLRAIVDEKPKGLGYKGWVSMELFSRTMADPSPSTPDEHARRGMESWKKLTKEMNW